MGADDPFSLLKNLTESYKGPSAPVNFTSYMPGGANFKAPNMASYKQQPAMNKTTGSSEMNESSGFNSRQRASPSPPPAIKRGNATRPDFLNAGFSVGGIGFGASAAPVTMPKDISSVIKNKDIFDKAQQRETSVDWYTQL